MTELPKHAEHYARRGWPVFPLLVGAKAPATSHGFKDATTDVKQVRQWWTQDPRYNIGLAVPPGVVVIDIDPRNGGNETARGLARDLGPLPHTRAATTGSGGQHYYLQTLLPPDQTQGALGSGVDVKIAGKGYVVAPPSRTTNGYRWTNSARLAFLPDSWARRMTKVARPPRAAHSPITDPVSIRGVVWWECSAMRHTEEGYRNPHLYAAARRLIERGCFDSGAEASLAEAAATAGLDTDEIAGVIGSAVRGAES